MRRRITWLVAATTSAVVLAFFIPLVLLVATLAEDRALAGAASEAQQVAVLVAGVESNAELATIVDLLNQRSPRSTGIRLVDGTTLGARLPAAGDPEMARALRGEAFTAVTDGARIYVPVAEGDDIVVVRTSVPSSELRSGTVSAWTTLAGLGTALLVAAVLVADRLGRWVSTPVIDLAAVAHRLREGDLAARARPDGPPEVVQLGRALNRFADRIGELMVAERESVADLSHRLRTPVTALRLDIEAVGDRPVADRLRQHVDHLTRSIDAIVKDARRPVSAAVERRCDVAAVVRDRVEFWSALAVDQARELHTDVPPTTVEAAIGADDLRDVVDVLLDNVFAHTPEGTAFGVRLGEGAGGRVDLEVTDDGPGPPTGDLTERGRSDAGSTGLGLDIARRAAVAAGGGLLIERRSPRGTRVVVTLGPPSG